jgi:hypothetical protein
MYPIASLSNGFFLIRVPTDRSGRGGVEVKATLYDFKNGQGYSDSALKPDLQILYLRWKVKFIFALLAGGTLIVCS